MLIGVDLLMKSNEKIIVLLRLQKMGRLLCQIRSICKGNDIMEDLATPGDINAGRNSRVGGDGS